MTGSKTNFPGRRVFPGNRSLSKMLSEDRDFMSTDQFCVVSLKLPPTITWHANVDEDDAERSRRPQNSNKSVDTGRQEFHIPRSDKTMERRSHYNSIFIKVFDRTRTGWTSSMLMPSPGSWWAEMGVNLKRNVLIATLLLTLTGNWHFSHFHVH